MRRMVKENLLKFDGTPLFPERIAYTVPYKLSNAEAQLYKAVTDYVREEFNRAEALQNDKRAGTVGFALTILTHAWRPRLRPSTSPCAAAANAWRSVAASWSCCSAALLRWRSPRLSPPWTPKTWRTWRRPPTTRWSR